MIHRRKKRLLVGAGALVALAGCAHTSLDTADSTAPAAAKIEPVYRVRQPVGTAAGQYAVGRMELGTGRVDAAIMRFRQALELDPNLVEAYNGLGVAYGQQGRFADADAAFRAGLVLAPDSPLLLNNLGYAQMRAGRYDEAWVSLDRAHRFDRSNAQTNENLALLAKARREVPVGRSPGSSAGQWAAPAAPAAAAETTAPGVAVPAPAVVASAAPAPVATAPMPPVAVTPATSAVAGVTPVAAPSARSTSSMQGVVLVPSDPAALVQVSPGIVELRPASTPRPAMTATTVAQPALAFPAAPVAAGAAVEPAVIVPPAPAMASVAPAARLAAGGSPAPVQGFEVSNGVGVRNLAGRTARALGRLGVPVDRVSDYRLFSVRRTEIHYRDGHRSAAEAVAGTLPSPVNPRFRRSGRLQQDINVRLVIGLDLSTRQVAWLGEESMQTDVAGDTAPIAGTIASAGAAASRLDPTMLAMVDAGRGWRHF